MAVDRTRCWLWGILTLALGLRLLAAVLVQQHVAQTPGRLCLIAGDAEGYWELGRQLARGQNYEIYQPPRRILRMPGFPALLAVSIALFGENVGIARMVLAVVGTLACGGVYWLGAELFDRNIGLIAAGLAAVSPTFVVSSVMMLSETAFALGLLLSLITLTWLTRSQYLPGTSRSRSMGLGILAGLTATVACYVRPSWLLFPPAAAGWLVIACVWDRVGSSISTLRNSRLLAAAALLLGMALGLAPWICRNYLVTDGRIVPTTLWMGPSLYDGLNPKANGDSHMEFLQHDALYQTQSEFAVDQYYRHAAWTWAARNPGRVVELGWIKLQRYWNLWPNTPQFNHWLIKASLLLFLLPMFGLAVWGLIRGLGSVTSNALPWSWLLILTAGPILYFSGLHTIFVSSLRYRLPAEYPLLILTAVGLRDVVRTGTATTVATWRMLLASAPTLAASATTVIAAPVLTRSINRQ